MADLALAASLPRHPRTSLFAAPRHPEFIPVPLTRRPALSLSLALPSPPIHYSPFDPSLSKCAALYFLLHVAGSFFPSPRFWFESVSSSASGPVASRIVCSRISSAGHFFGDRNETTPRPALKPPVHFESSPRRSPSSTHCNELLLTLGTQLA